MRWTSEIQTDAFVRAIATIVSAIAHSAVGDAALGGSALESPRRTAVHAACLIAVIAAVVNAVAELSEAHASRIVALEDARYAGSIQGAVELVGAVLAVDLKIRK